jgi:hypothetical protein
MSFRPVTKFCLTPFLGAATSIRMRDASRVIKLQPLAGENLALVSSMYVSSINDKNASIQAKDYVREREMQPLVKVNPV